VGVAVCPKRCRDEPESFVFILLSVLGLVTMVSANHLMTLYVGIELATFPVLAWIALRRDNSRALEGALKYFVLSALASGIMLFGMALIFCGGLSLVSRSTRGADKSNIFNRRLFGFGGADV